MIAYGVQAFQSEPMGWPKSNNFRLAWSPLDEHPDTHHKRIPDPAWENANSYPGCRDIVRQNRLRRFIRLLQTSLEGLYGGRNGLIIAINAITFTPLSSGVIFWYLERKSSESWNDFSDPEQGIERKNNKYHPNWSIDLWALNVFVRFMMLPRKHGITRNF
jgi:hypothetical protein